MTLLAADDLATHMGLESPEGLQPALDIAELLVAVSLGELAPEPVQREQSVKLVIDRNGIGTADGSVRAVTEVLIDGDPSRSTVSRWVVMDSDQKMTALQHDHGYANAKDVPARMKQAMLVTAAEFQNAREDTAKSERTGDFAVSYALGKRRGSPVSKEAGELLAEVGLAAE